VPGGEGDARALRKGGRRNVCGQETAFRPNEGRNCSYENGGKGDAQLDSWISRGKGNSNRAHFRKETKGIEGKGRISLIRKKRREKGEE